ncbi:MAG: transposase [Polyangiaceae bacterium]|nr:transposase [Polyangiaceae bacterium]
MAHNVEIRVTRWLERKWLLRAPSSDNDFHNDRPERSALDACLEGSLGLGDLTALAPGNGLGVGDAPAEDAPEPARPTKSARRGGKARGFDVHAGVVVAASDRAGSQRLLRYCARPPLSLQRLSVLQDGRIAYELRKPWGPQTHRVMEPLAFMARLAALVPPPRHPLIRFHGVFAPHSSWQDAVVPQAEVARKTEGRSRTTSAVCQNGGKQPSHGGDLHSSWPCLEAHQARAQGQHGPGGLERARGGDKRRRGGRGRRSREALR